MADMDGVFEAMVPQLKGVTQAELELPLRGIRIALSGNPAEILVGRAIVRVVQVGVVEVVECLSLEDQLLILVAWNDVEAFLQRRAGAVEAGTEDHPAHSTWSKGIRRSR